VHNCKEKVDNVSEVEFQVHNCKEKVDRIESSGQEIRKKGNKPCDGVILRT